LRSWPGEKVQTVCRVIGVCVVPVLQHRPQTKHTRFRDYFAVPPEPVPLDDVPDESGVPDEEVPAPELGIVVLPELPVLLGLLDDPLAPLL
jgi:hypothetical protein